MKKRLAKIDVRAQLALVGAGLAIFAVSGYLFVVSPQSAKATQVRAQISAEQAEVFRRRSALQKGLHPPAIQVADLFKLSRAMPDRLDMPGIILGLSDVARAAGIKFELIEPSLSAEIPAGSGYTPVRIHLQFNGDFYGLSDFLYRIRSLVAVHDGVLQADGRLFNVETVSFNAGTSFPQISADLLVDAYVYSNGAPPAGLTAPPPAAPPPTTTTATTTTTTTTSTPSDPASLPGGATAAGATP